jgi:hypothetical protein
MTESIVLGMESQERPAAVEAMYATERVLGDGRYATTVEGHAQNARPGPASSCRSGCACSRPGRSARPTRTLALVGVRITGLPAVVSDTKRAQLRVQVDRRCSSGRREPRHRRLGSVTSRTRHHRDYAAAQDHLLTQKAARSGRFRPCETRAISSGELAPSRRAPRPATAAHLSLAATPGRGAQDESVADPGCPITADMSETPQWPTSLPPRT